MNVLPVVPGLVQGPGDVVTVVEELVDDPEKSELFIKRSLLQVNNEFDYRRGIVESMETYEEPWNQL